MTVSVDNDTEPHPNWNVVKVGNTWYLVRKTKTVTIDGDTVTGVPANDVSSSVDVPLKAVVGDGAGLNTAKAIVSVTVAPDLLVTFQDKNNVNGAKSRDVMVNESTQSITSTLDPIYTYTSQQSYTGGQTLLVLYGDDASSPTDNTMTFSNQTDALSWVNYTSSGGGPILTQLVRQPVRLILIH